MKKIIILLLIYFMFSIELKVVFGDDYQVFKNASGELYSFETTNGDIVSFLKKVGEYKYRVELNSKKAIDIDFNDSKISFLYFFESTSYYYFYGSVYDKNDTSFSTTIPYIVRFEKNLDGLIYYFSDNENSGMAHYLSMMEYKTDNIILTEFYSGIYGRLGIYEGYYRLSYFNELLEYKTSIPCGTHECSLSGCYNYIDLKDSYNNHTYFDDELNIVEDYKASETKYGCFELYTRCMVDGEYYDIGEVFSTPGEYILSDGIHEEKRIIIQPVITIIGEKSGNFYKDYVEFRVSGGIVKINSEIKYLSGIISKPGKYIIEVDGVDGYILTETILISPYLLSQIENGGVVEAGSIISFCGEAKLNNTIISNGYVVRDPGNYTLDLMIDGEVYERIVFTVPNIEVTNNEKLGFNIALSIITIIIGGLIIYLLFMDNKKKKKQEH